MIGYVYKIIHKTDASVLPYIGSTIQHLSKRMSKHKGDFEGWKNGKVSLVMIFHHFQKYGKENFKIVELSRYDIKDRQELNKYEQDWIDRTFCCNKINAHGRNKVKELESQRRTLRTQKRKDYVIKYSNSDHMKEYYRAWQKKNLRISVRCEICNKQMQKGSLYLHLRSVKHNHNETIYYFSILPQL